MNASNAEPARDPTQETSPYQRALHEGQQALRRALLDAASHLLVSEGPQALSMRRVTSEVGCSTTVLYTMFGGKDGLSEALYLEGFARLRERLAQVPRGEDPNSYLHALGRTYRDFALTEHNYYRVMFGNAIPGYQPSELAREAGRTTLGFLEEAIAACVDRGLFAPGDPHVMAELLWAAAHGTVSLELAGHFCAGEGADRYEAATVGIVCSFLAFLPDDDHITTSRDEVDSSTTA